jgi:hypothetical protein
MILEFIRVVLSLVQLWLESFVNEYLVLFDEYRVNPRLIYQSVGHAVAMSGSELLSLLAKCLGSDRRAKDGLTQFIYPIDEKVKISRWYRCKTSSEHVIAAIMYRFGKDKGFESILKFI